MLLLLPLACLGDTVTMKDGTFLKGRIERIVDGVMEFRAPSLGAANLLRLELGQVESFVTDESVRVSAGGVVSDGVASAAGGRVVTRGGRETNTLDQAAFTAALAGRGQRFEALRQVARALRDGGARHAADLGQRGVVSPSISTHGLGRPLPRPRSL